MNACLGLSVRFPTGSARVAAMLKRIHVASASTRKSRMRDDKTSEEKHPLCLTVLHSAAKCKSRSV